MDTPDAALVTRWVRQRDQKAFAMIVRRYTAMVTSLIRSILGDVQDLDDLVQETFLEGYFKLDALRDRDRLGPWLARVAQNHAKMWLRSGKRRELRQERIRSEAVREAQTASDVLKDPEQPQALWNAVGQLTYNTRIVTVLYYMDGFSQRDIAGFLGVSEVSVRQRLYQARQRLRSLYPTLMDNKPVRWTAVSYKLVDKVMKRGAKQMESTPTILEKLKDGEETRYFTMNLFDKLLRDRIIMVSGVIDDNLASRVIAQLLYVESQNRYQPVYVYITSRGGDVMAGMAIYDTIRQMMSPELAVYTYCVGHVAGIATLILAGGTPGKRYILPNAGVMIHQPDREQVQDIMELYEERALVKFRSRTYELLASHTGKDHKEIEKDAQRGVFLTAEEAQAYGMVDQIVGVSV